MAKSWLVAKATPKYYHTGFQKSVQDTNKLNTQLTKIALLARAVCHHWSQFK